MRKILYISILFPLAVSAQDNYVKTTAYKVGTTTTMSTPDIDDANVQVTYFDGLGRPIQQNAGKMSTDGKDIITHLEYDAYGRQPKAYLPYTSSKSGAYDTNAADNLTDFYGSTYEVTTDVPYSEKFYEPSPLNRVLKQGAPGRTWQGDPGSDDDHTVKYAFGTNIADEVRYYTADIGSGGAVTLSDNGYYSKNRLYKTTVKNENWIADSEAYSEEFKDKEGRLVLKRVFGVSTAGSSEVDEAHDTYYVYDIYGNLAFVIPPLADQAGTIALDDLCYQYKYDSKNRLIEKKLPGKQWEFIVYDILDRVAATGPALSPFGSGDTGWLVTKYDMFGRVAYTLWLPDSGISSSGRDGLQADFDAVATPYETRRETTTSSSVDDVYTSANAPESGYQLLSVNYYDGYSFPHGLGTLSGTILGQDIVSNVKGLPTGSWVRALISDTDMSGDTTYILYDKKGRPICTTVTNYLGGNTQSYTEYNFSGQPLHTSVKQKRLSTDTAITADDYFEYTHQGRLVNHTHAINSGTLQLLAHYDYDKLGRVTTKQVGGTDVEDYIGLQQVDYTYNIRGWLKGINDVTDLTITGQPADLFAFKINYDDPDDGDTTPLYNGNISETSWRSNSDNQLRRYAYTYDSMNRLRNAEYQKPSSTSSIPHAYDESETYDKNGNIVALQRNGNFDDEIIQLQIDDLTYTYADHSNRLMKVADATLNPNGFKDGTNEGDDYTYDDNGNLLSDENKHIESITYNHLNLPVLITFTSGDTISYLYDAAGGKLSKTVTWASTTTPASDVTDYLNGFQYVNSVLSFFPDSEGYVKVTHDGESTFYSYVYNYTDHLGNVRMSWAWDTHDLVVKILEESHYYPYGLKHTNYNSNQLIFHHHEEDLLLVAADPGDNIDYQEKFNGKEWQHDLALNEYDYGARNYDPAIGRWMNMDPLAETTRKWSPYNYCMDSPVFFRDPDGMQSDGKHMDFTVDSEGRSKEDWRKVYIAPMDRQDSVGGDSWSDRFNESCGMIVNDSESEADIQYPEGSDYEEKFSKFTEVLKKLYDFVKDNDDILSALADSSGYSKDQVLDQLKYGKGGVLTPKTLLVGDYGEVDPTTHAMSIEIKFVRGLQTAKLRETKLGTSFLLAITVLHEFVHYARRQNGLDDHRWEYGEGFERQIFNGNEINKSNAYELFKRYGRGWTFEF